MLFLAPQGRLRATSLPVCRYKFPLPVWLQFNKMPQRKGPDLGPDSAEARSYWNCKKPELWWVLTANTQRDWEPTGSESICPVHLHAFFEIETLCQAAGGEIYGGLETLLLKKQSTQFPSGLEGQVPVLGTCPAR